MANLVRTDMHCHACDRSFIAQIDYDIDGNHIVLCPYVGCRHQHCRVIKDGVVTDDRWQSRNTDIEIPDDCVWQCENTPVVTSMASHFLREAWMNRLDLHGGIS